MTAPGPPGTALSGERERTDFAWNRSGLAVLGVLAVILRRIWPLDETGLVVVLALASAGAVAWVIVMLSGWKLTASARAHGGTLGTRMIGLIALGTFLLALAGIVLALITVD